MENKSEAILKAKSMLDKLSKEDIELLFSESSFPATTPKKKKKKKDKDALTMKFLANN